MSTLCVADDNELDQRIIKLNLIRYPVFKHVLHFYSGAQLINYLTENKTDSANLPDIILLSLSMSQSDGLNVLEALESLYPKLSKKISVYIMSSSIIPKGIDKALGYEFVKDFIAKPISKDILTSLSKDRDYTYR